MRYATTLPLNIFISAENNLPRRLKTCAQATHPALAGRGEQRFFGVSPGDRGHHDVRDRARVRVLRPLPLQGVSSFV